MRMVRVTLLAVCFMLIIIFPVHAGYQARNIAGDYVLFHKGDLDGKAQGYMSIWNQQGFQFSIGITARTGESDVDWEGNGEISGDKGFTPI